MLLEGTHALAQPAPNPCGKTPEYDRATQASEQSKVDAKGKAEALSKFFGSVELSAQIQKDKSTIFQNPNEAEASRSFAYYQYVVCVMIFQDGTLDLQRRISVWRDAQQSFNDKRSENPPELIPATCTRREFGQIGWERKETIEQDSGWGDGNGQDNWCNELISKTVSSRAIGQDRNVTINDKGEKQRWTGVRHREYNYRCKITIEWSPIYATRQDPLCGFTQTSR
jgi:hypothetical protein